MLCSATEMKRYSRGSGKELLYFRDPQNIMKDERKLQRYCCSFCCQPQRILICCKKSTLPECLARSSYWQTFLCLTYMCFLVFKTKSSIYEEKILNSLQLQKKVSMLYKPTSIRSVCYQHAIISSGKPQGSLRLSLLFPFFVACKVISQFPCARNQLYLVLDCK